MGHPTPDTVAEWDDASLFAAAGCESALRYHQDGFESLNDAERSLCCLYLLEAEVNNGGFGQWIWNVCPSAAAETPLVLQAIGATQMASFVANILLKFGDLKRFRSQDEWLDHYESRPDDVHEHLETLSRPFLELEDSFLELAYVYTRANWASVRIAQQGVAPEHARRSALQRLLLRLRFWIVLSFTHWACALIVVFLGRQVGADDRLVPTVAPGEVRVGADQTRIATLFGEPLYLEQVTPAEVEVKRQELPHAEFGDWLRKSRGARTYDRVWGAVRRTYMERENLGVTKAESAAIAASVERQWKSIPEPKDSALTPEQRQGIMIAWARASLMDWKVCKSLYEKYGGRVGIGSLGAWTAFDGQNALIREHYKAGDIKFHHAEMEASFWQHTRIKNFADAYPTGERLKRLFATPPYQREEPNGEEPNGTNQTGREGHAASHAANRATTRSSQNKWLRPI